MATFPSLRWPQPRRILEAEPLGYKADDKNRGSHHKLASRHGYPVLRLAFHDRDEIPPGLVRKILVRDVGLSVQEALDLLG